MFRFLKYVFNIMILVVLGALLFYLVISPEMVKEVLKEIMYNFDNKVYQIIVIVVLAIYFLVFVLSYLEKLLKKKRTVSVNTKNGRIEVNFNTLENITKTFLETQSIIKTVKVGIVATYSRPNILVDVECYKTHNLNEKLDKIKAELEEHILSMVGIKPKNTTIKVVKIDSEIAIEKIEVDEVINEPVSEVIGENIE